MYTNVTPFWPSELAPASEAILNPVPIMLMTRWVRKKIAENGSMHHADMNPKTDLERLEGPTFLARNP